MKPTSTASPPELPPEPPPDKPALQGEPAKRRRPARPAPATRGPPEPGSSLEEIAVWVNEGGGGGEVRR